MCEPTAIPPWSESTKHLLCIWWKDLTVLARQRVLEFYNIDTPLESWVENIDPVACVFKFPAEMFDNDDLRD